MTTSEKVIAFGIVGLAAYWFYSKSKALLGLIFAAGKITGASLTGGAPVIDLSLTVQNTSTSSLVINSFAGNVYANGTLVGNVGNFSPVAIPANSQTALPVTAQLQIIGLANDILKAVDTGTLSQNINIKGSANVNGIQLPVDVTFAAG